MTRKENRQLEIINQILELLKEYQVARRKNGFSGISDGFMFQFQKELTTLAEEIERKQGVGLSESSFCKLCGREGLFMSIMPTTIGGVGTLKAGRVSDWYESRSLSKEGLCKICEPHVAEQVERRGAVLNKCMEGIQREKDRHQLIKLCTLILENSKALHELEKKSISTIEPKPADIMNEYQELFRVLNETFSHE